MDLKDLPVTYWLLIIFFAVFVAQMVGLATEVPFTEALVLNPIAILSGRQLWGIFTNIFLHGGIFHIFFNSWAMFMFGLSLERIIGGRNLLKVFLASGLFASVFYVLTSVFLLDSGTSALGASGAIFGVIGAMVALRPRAKVMLIFLPVPLELWMLAILFTLIAVLWFGGGGGTGIAENAHLGGLIAGLLLGLYYRRREKADRDFTWKAVYRPKDEHGWIDAYK